MRDLLVAIAVLTMVWFGMSCSRAEEAVQAAPGDGAADSRRDIPDVFGVDMPVELQDRVDQLVAEQEGMGALTEEEWQRAVGMLEQYPSGSGMRPPEVYDFFKALGARTSLVTTRLLVDADPGRRQWGLSALGLARPYVSAEDDRVAFNEAVARPLLLRSTYDVDASVRNSAFASFAGIARFSRRGIGTIPPELIPRAKELLADPDPGMAKSAAHFLWEFGELDLLTSEQIEEFEKGPRE